MYGHKRIWLTLNSTFWEGLTEYRTFKQRTEEGEGATVSKAASLYQKSKVKALGNTWQTIFPQFYGDQ